MLIEEKLMLRLIGEGDDFGLDGGAVARTDALDLTVVEGGIREAAAKHLMGGFIGVYQRALALTQGTFHLRQI